MSAELKPANLPAVQEAPPLRGLDFHGSPLATFEHAGERWVVMRPVVEGMGLNWSGQYTRLRSAEKRWGLRVFGYPNTSGGIQETLCIPLKRYPGWVNTINTAKIPDPAVRQRVELYQDASAEALYQFWATGAATVERVAAVMRAALEPTIPPRSTLLLRAMGGWPAEYRAARSTPRAEHIAGPVGHCRRHGCPRRLQARAAALPSPTWPVPTQGRADPRDGCLTEFRHHA